MVGVTGEYCSLCMKHMFLADTSLLGYPRLPTNIILLPTPTHMQAYYYKKLLLVPLYSATFPQMCINLALSTPYSVLPSRGDTNSTRMF